jgi:hypothetical protein
VDQGMNNTCNVTTVENRLYTREPSKVAQLVADVALSGKYITSSGETIDVAALSGGLKPDFEARQSLRLQNKGKADVKYDGGRDWSSQLVERALANIKWTEKPILVSGNRMLWDTALVYDSKGALRGKVNDPLSEIISLHDKNGKQISSYKAGDEVFTKNGKPIKDLKEEDLAYNSDGAFAGKVEKSSLRLLFDADGKVLRRFDSHETRAFDKDGRVSIERIFPNYDKQGGSNIFMTGKERVYYDQMGKEVKLRDFWGKKFDSPSVYTHELHRIHNEVTGSNPEAFAFVRAKTTKEYSNEIDVASVADFEKAIMKLQNNNNLPGIALVHTSFPPFSWGLDAATGFMGGWHVVNIQGYDPATKMVKMSNQWGSGMDYEGKGVHIDTLFRSMQDPLLKRVYKRWKYGKDN